MAKIIDNLVDKLKQAKELENKKVRRKSTKEIVENRLQDELDLVTYNAIGFLPMCEGTGTAELIQNVALSFDKTKQVCIVDLEDYYPKLYKIFGVKYKKREQGLLNALNLKEDEDIKEHFLKTQYDNIYLIGFSQLLDIDHIEADDVESTITAMRVFIDDLKSRFSVVLINIPNHPTSEYFYAGLLSVDMGFIVINQQVEWIDNYYKLAGMSFVTASLGGLGTFDKVIVNNYLGLDSSYEGVEKLGMELASVVPLEPEVIAYASEGKCYINDSPMINADYADAINEIVGKIQAS